MPVNRWLGNTGTENEPYPDIGILQPNVGTICISHNLKSSAWPAPGELESIKAYKVSDITFQDFWCSKQ